VADLRRRRIGSKRLPSSFFETPFHNVLQVEKTSEKVMKKKNKMAELATSSSFGSSAIYPLTRSAAFRPLLTEGLALSGWA